MASLLRWWVSWLAFRFLLSRLLHLLTGCFDVAVALALLCVITHPAGTQHLPLVSNIGDLSVQDRC